MYALPLPIEAFGIGVFGAKLQKKEIGYSKKVTFAVFDLTYIEF